MGNLTLTYPDAYEAQLIQGLRDYLGPDAEGLTATQAASKALLRFAKGEARRVARKEATSAQVAKAERDLSFRELAAVVAVQARKDAEDVANEVTEALVS